MLGLLAALPQEITSLVGPLKPGGSASLGPQCRVQLCGVGADNARRAALALADAGATRLLSWGSAGGIAPALPAGSVLLPLTVRGANGHGFSVTSTWHQQLHAQLSKALPIHTGDLLEVSQVVASPQEKQRLFQGTGALAVDMESAAIAQVAAQRGLGFAALRVVLDSAQRSLPAAALVALDSAGHLQLAALLRALLLRPQDWAGLLQLRSDLRLTQSCLRRAAQLTGLQPAAQPAKVLA